MDTEKGMCFVIMPISDPKGYEEGHFLRVYEDIFKPAIQEAGFISHRVDEDSSSGLIQAKIIQNLIEAPMAICDLSTRNPNVLFELGIRQAFDRPVVLVQEEGTERIFDINGISCIDYDPKLLYHKVLDSQKSISHAICETERKPAYNSLIKLLKLSSAQMPEDSLSKTDMNEVMLTGIVSSVREISDEIHKIRDEQRLERRIRQQQPSRITHITDSPTMKRLNELYTPEGIAKLLGDSDVAEESAELLNKIYKININQKTTKKSEEDSEQ